MGDDQQKILAGLSSLGCLLILFGLFGVPILLFVAWLVVASILSWIG